MTYVSPNFKSKGEMKLALAAGIVVRVFEPGLGDLGTSGGFTAVEGPHSPQPHTWYAKVEYDERRCIVNVQ